MVLMATKNSSPTVSEEESMWPKLEVPTCPKCGEKILISTGEWSPEACAILRHFFGDQDMLSSHHHEFTATDDVDLEFEDGVAQ